jgi:putative oxidoreductase
MKDESRFVNVVGRILMASLFLVAGIRKLLTWKMMLAYFSGLGLPFPEIVLPLTIAVEIGGGVALIVGWRPRELSLILAAFTLFTALVAHRFWAADSAQFNNQLNHFFKNVALTGGFLVLFSGAKYRLKNPQEANVGKETVTAP